MDSRLRTVGLILLAVAVVNVAAVGAERPPPTLRLIVLQVWLDGVLVLEGTEQDIGIAGPDTVWGYWGYVALGEKSNKIVPDKNPGKKDGKTATLKGKVRLHARYGGSAELTELKLTGESPGWQLAPGEMARIRKMRTDKDK